MESYISGSDGASSLCALKNAVRDAMPDVEMIPKERVLWVIPLRKEKRRTQPKKSIDKVGVLKSSLEENLQQHVPADQPILTR